MSISFAALFSDHAVLQRDTYNPIWGWDEPGQDVTLTLGDVAARAKAGPDGRWQVRLPPLPAGGPFELAASGSARIVARDLWIGEVWYASGQSNMQMTVEQAGDALAEIAAARFPAIRMFEVPRAAVVTPPRDAAGAWSVCAPETAGAFSAAAYYFARELHRRLKMPVGILHGSWGGTIAEAWTPREALLAEPALREIVSSYERELPEFERRAADFEAKMKDQFRHYPADPGNTGHALGWAKPDTDLSGWDTMNTPGNWFGAGLNFNGVVWFRREVEVPAAWAGRDLTLRLCPCDKHDTTYFNNTVIGGIGPENPEAWSVPRTYRVPGHLVKAGRNTIAVRIYSYVYAGGFLGKPDQMRLEPPARNDSEQALPLSGPWRYRVEHTFGRVTPIPLQRPRGPGNPNSPYALFNGMVRPVIPYGIRGVIWYQGESNAERAEEYRVLFPTLIRSWRQAWGQGEFPFLFVQLANYRARALEPCASTWAALREAQAQALLLPNTGMAVALDIGEAADIHPKNKQDVGRRLARLALRHTYGFQDVVPCGPVFASVREEPGRLRLSFTHTEGGLTIKGEHLEGFDLAGADRRFVRAAAAIEGDTVVVSSPAVPAPKAARYGWADNPAATLANGAGLPAAPFRTDDWPLP
jgi:sialate O-acetylesterase